MKHTKNKHKKLVRKRCHARNYESDNQYQPYKKYMKDEISEVL